MEQSVSATKFVLRDNNLYYYRTPTYLSAPLSLSLSLFLFLSLCVSFSLSRFVFALSHPLSPCCEQDTNAAGFIPLLSASLHIDGQSLPRGHKERTHVLAHRRDRRGQGRWVNTIRLCISGVDVVGVARAQEPHEPHPRGSVVPSRAMSPLPASGGSTVRCRPSGRAQAQWPCCPALCWGGGHPLPLPPSDRVPYRAHHRCPRPHAATAPAAARGLPLRPHRLPRPAPGV